MKWLPFLLVVTTCPHLHQLPLPTWSTVRKIVIISWRGLTCSYLSLLVGGGGGPYFEPRANEYYQTHDHLGYIGADRNATVAAHNVYVPPSMFNLPQPPPQHYQQVSEGGGGPPSLPPSPVAHPNSISPIPSRLLLHLVKGLMLRRSCWTVRLVRISSCPPSKVVPPPPPPPPPSHSHRTWASPWHLPHSHYHRNYLR